MASKTPKGTDVDLVFISYGRKDAAEFAKKLADWLRKEGFEPWLDVEHGVRIGDPFDRRIEEGIRASRMLVFLLTRHSLREESFCRNELLFAQANAKPIIPLRLQNILPPIQIISVNYIDAVEDPDVAFKELPRALRQVKEEGSISRRDWPSTTTDKPWWATLEKLNFEEELAVHGGSFTGREWLFKELEGRLSKLGHGIILLVGDAGVGKSAIAAQATARLNVKGVHFCSLSNIDSCNPVTWLRELIYQLAGQFPSYRDRLPKNEPDWSRPPESLCREWIFDLLRKPDKEDPHSEPYVLVVDGLDEAKASNFGLQMAQLLSLSEKRLPPWLRIIATSRPDTEILSLFRGEQIVDIDPDSTEDPYFGKNKEEAAQYITQRATKSALLAPFKQLLTKSLPEKAAGNFLFAKMMLDALTHHNHKFRLSIENLDKLPGDLEQLYRQMFDKRFPDPQTYRREVRPLVNCLVAAQDFFPEDLLGPATNLREDSVQDGLLALSQFLRTTDRGVSLFHKSIVEWLSKKERSATFAAFPSLGHELIADRGWKEYESGIETMVPYNQRYLPVHLVKADRWNNVFQLLTDLRFFSLKWSHDSNAVRDIAEILKSCVRRYGQSKELSRLGKSFQKLGEICTDRGLSGDAIQLYEGAERICMVCEDMVGLQAALCGQGMILERRGKLDKALELYKKQEHICRDLGRDDCLQVSLCNQGLIEWERNDFDRAMKFYKEQEKICRALGLKESLQACLGNQANILADLADLQDATEAKQLYDEQERICRQLGLEGDLQRCLGNQARFLLEMAQRHESNRSETVLETALALVKEKEKICQELNLPESLQYGLGYKGRIMTEMGKRDEAMALFKQQEDICRKHDFGRGLIWALWNQGQAMTKMVSHRRALSLFREQERLSRSIGSIDGQLTSLGNQAEALVNLGQPDKAMALLRKKEKLCHKQKVPHQLVRALFAQGEILVQNPTHRPEVLRVLEETERLSKEHGYTKLSQRVERFRNKLH